MEKLDCFEINDMLAIHFLCFMLLKWFKVNWMNEWGKIGLLWDQRYVSNPLFPCFMLFKWFEVNWREWMWENRIALRSTICWLHFSTIGKLWRFFGIFFQKCTAFKNIKFEGNVFLGRYIFKKSFIKFEEKIYNVRKLCKHCKI